MNWQLPTGARVTGDGTRFRVWAPDVRQVRVVIFDEDGKEQRRQPLEKDKDGYFSGTIPGVGHGTRYMYALDGEKTRPDPASRYQPEGVHGPSMVVDPSFPWTSQDWQGIPLEDMVLYELHVGTFTQDGTFDALIEKLPYIKALGVTAVEIMPVADFPGDRNWGYDGVDLFAPARAYGGPENFKKMIDAAHKEGLAVVLDVMYNHLGPDGNYLRDFSKDYFTDDKKTPWGDALNFANPHVREYFISNAIYWAQEYRVDGFRLDATHAILDDSEEHILAEIPRRVKETLPEGRHFVIFAEDERNEVWLITTAEKGGAGIDAAWADDFHHEVRSALAGDNEGYYADYTGSALDLAETLTRGWFYAGQISDHSGKPRGTGTGNTDPAQFVYCIQNHDQVGNRALGDRLTGSISLDAYRAASALLLLSPYTPLLFQGQEWAATTPFLFFTDHNEELGKMVTEGRRAEFAYFSSFSGKQVPDPQAQSTFEASKLNWQEVEEGDHAKTLALYKELLRLRRELPAFRLRKREHFRSEQVDEDAIALRYLSPSGSDDLLLLVNLKGDLNLSLTEQEVTRAPEGRAWRLLLSTNDKRFGSMPSREQEFDPASRIVHASSPVTLLFRAIS